ncbi:MAG: multi-sensor signal transduction histidine kinase [Xanthobacteraceae bacterium]|nr:multi-sensor signal transduction histidine kinase [Xanthobacteraceae bacterium]
MDHDAGGRGHLNIPVFLAKLDELTPVQRLVALWIFGGVALALVTWASVHFELNLATTAAALLIVIVLLSLLDSFVSSAFFSLIAILSLNYFFVQPLYTLDVSEVQDIAALAAFLVCSLTVTGLVRRLRDSADIQREQAQLLELTADAIIVRDMDGAISYWNRGAEQLYGWSRADAIGKVTHDLLQTRFPVPLAQINALLLDAGRWEGELVHRRRDGTEVPVASRWAVQKDARGQPVGILENNTDITERKQADELLHRSQAAFLAEAQRLSHTGSFGWNVVTGRIHWSDETFRIFGYEPAAEPSIDLLIQRTHPDDAVRVRETIYRAADGERGFDFEFRLLMPDGTVRHVHAVAHSMRNGSPDLHYVGAVSDITPAKEALAERARAQEMLDRVQADLAHAARVSVLGELTASIAHEVNQPLTAIASSAAAGVRWLRRPVPNIEEVRELADSIVSDAQRAGEIISRIRAMAARKAPERTLLVLDEVIGEVLLFLRNEARSRTVTVLQYTAPEAPQVLGDRTQLQQVIVNLAINAMQAMVQAGSSERRVVIRTLAADGTSVRCIVEDSGPGIPPEHIDRLFESFFTTKPSGMGMGLPICRSIIEAHGGRITVDRAGTAGGASFSFTLPAASEQI